MSRSNAPIVTGVSPKEGPPGTNVKVRGENFGFSASDVINLTICGSDCTLSAEWKSPNKIVARSGPGKGSGDIIITTRQGGIGTCTVKFRGYTETIGPTKESAVWVDPPPTHSYGSSLSPTSFTQEDPLGLSVEASEKAIHEDDLNELFPGSSGDLGNDQFLSGRFLLEHHQFTNFDDLKAGLAHMKRNIDNQRRGELSFLKANVSSVLDQHLTLQKLKEKYEEDAKSSPDFTCRVIRKIEETKEEAHRLFKDVLARRERADTTRNALAVLQRYKFLFCLPTVIELNMQKGDYDVIINDYARVRCLFANTKVAPFQKALNEIDTRVAAVRLALTRKLQDNQWSSVSSVDDYIKVVRNLVHLDEKEDVAWMALDAFSTHLEQNMHDLKDKFIVLETSESSKKGKTSLSKLQEGKPHRVQFVEELVDLMEMRFPELWKLGQTYFKDEFSIENDSSNHEKFKNSVLNNITTFCNLLQAAILPHLLRNSQKRQSYGIWSNSGFDAVIIWLPHCLRYFRACYSCFIRIDLPTDVLDIFSNLIFDLRLFIVTSLFRQASSDISNLAKQENWNIDIHDVYGGLTQLPALFESICKKVIQTAHDTVMMGDVRESQLMENVSAKKEALAAMHSLFVSFGLAMESLSAGPDNDEQGRGAVLSQLVGTSDSHRQTSHRITWERRLLAVQCNCEYITGVVNPSLFQVIRNCGFPFSKLEETNANAVFMTIGQKILDQYHELKCDPLVGTIEPSMYFPQFDWDTTITPTDARPYAKEIIMNLIGVRAVLYRVPPKTVRRIMCKIVETVAEELARLMSCVKKFSLAGSIQALVDVTAIRTALKAYNTVKSQKFYSEALERIPQISREGERAVKTALDNFQSLMQLQLLCLNEKV